MKPAKNSLKRLNEQGFGVFGVLVVLVVLITIGCVGFIVFIGSQVKFFPDPPELTSYQQIEKEQIAVKSGETQVLQKTAQDTFEEENTWLKPAGQDSLDGCGLYDAQSTTNTSASYMKTCSLYVTSFYSSTHSLPETVTKLEQWATNDPSRVFSLEPDTCGLYPEVGSTTTAGKISISAFPLDGDAPTTSCNRYYRYAKSSTPTYSAGLLSGAVGIDESYREVHSMSNLDRQKLTAAMLINGDKTFVAVNWRSPYYTYTFYR